VKKQTFILIFITAMIMPLWAQTAADFRVAFTSDRTGVIIRGYSGAELEVVIPNTIQFMPVKEIGREAFRSSNITSIVIPEGVTIIHESAFADCSELSSVTLPNSLTSIDAFAFSNCTSLSTITFPNSLTIIGRGAFQESGLTSVSWPAGIHVISSRAFYNCKNLQSVTIPEGITTIGSFAFFGCSGLTTIALPRTINRINEGAFNSCTALTTVTIPSSVRSINFSEQEPQNLSEIKSFSGCSYMSSASQRALRRVGYTGDF
jgi:hypothetical protein